MNETQLELAAKRTGPSINRGGSQQVVGTPPAFVAACERRFGQIVIDLAATAENAKCVRYFTKEQNSLIQPWHEERGIGWLNPEYSNIGQWAKKCAQEAILGAAILMLVPASVGSNWYRDFVFNAPRARTVYINGRIIFLGEKQPYPKDLMLCVYGIDGPSHEIWTPAKDELR